MTCGGLHKLMKYIACTMLSVALLVGGNALAKDAPRANPFDKVLIAVPAAELPAKVADLVLQAKPRDQQATTVNVVKSAVGLNPAAAPAIVGAIARAVPAMASVAAGAAAAEQPKQASAIAKAATAAAPSQAGAIVKAVCRAVPNEYRNIAVAVSQAAPGSGTEILKGIESALPDLKPSIDRVLAGYGGNVASVGGTLDQAAQVQPTTQPVTMPTFPSAGTPQNVLVGFPPRGPSGGLPYIPLTSTPTNVTSSSSGEVPGGGRNYAAP
jgi:hypothetical protein